MPGNLSERNLSCQKKIQKEYSNKIKQNNKIPYVF